MDSNGVTTQVSPEDAMLRMGTDDESAGDARQLMTAEIKARLTLSPSKMSFVSTGTTTIEWQTRDGGWQSIDVPIRSLTPQILQEIADRYRQDLTTIPRKWDEEEKAYVPDETAPEAIEWLANANAFAVAARYDRIVHGFDGDIESLDGSAVVWSARAPKGNDLAAALASFKALGIPHSELEKLDAAISDLSVKQALDDSEEFKKKQSPL